MVDRLCEKSQKINTAMTNYFIDLFVFFNYLFRKTKHISKYDCDGMRKVYHSFS